MSIPETGLPRKPSSISDRNVAEVTVPEIYTRDARQRQKQIQPGTCRTETADCKMRDYPIIGTC